ncbi:hypothetical protein L7F22_054277 [Adiantum nelumboides]|nr:hypothetical protein [Adiantum nelumboides]
MPFDQNVKLRADEDQVLEDVTMYRQIVGSLIYLTISRPDLSYSVGLESQFMQLPRKPHLDVVRRTLRYVSATLDYALFYEASIELQLCGSQMQIGLVVYVIDDLPAILCFHLGVLLSLGAARSNPQLLYRV